MLLWLCIRTKGKVRSVNARQFFYLFIFFYFSIIYHNKESNQSTWSCQTGASNSGLHASADELTALWRAARPFCPEGEKDIINHKELLG